MTTDHCPRSIPARSVYRIPRYSIRLNLPAKFESAQRYAPRADLLVMPILPPELAYSLGLVSQTLTDVSPGGLTLEGLGRRTKLAPTTLSVVLRVGLERHHVLRVAARYYAACAQD